MNIITGNVMPIETYFSCYRLANSYINNRIYQLKGALMNEGANAPKYPSSNGPDDDEAAHGRVRDMAVSNAWTLPASVDTMS